MSPFLAAGLGTLVLLLYGAHLREGFLADDFVYATWLDQGLGELLRRVTIASDPRIIRPLPAFGWWFASWSGGVLIQHALSLLLHTLCGVLVARLAERCRAGSGLLAALLFVTFPLFAEPVIWLSSAFDLWAAFFALAALLVGLGQGSRSSAALLFALSLLSKESTLLLPLLPLCLPAAAPFARRRRLALDLALVAAAYLLLRLGLFGGPGGYLDDAGHSLAWRLEPLRFLKNALLGLPYHLLIPLKRAGELAPLLVMTSAVLGALVLATTRPWQRPRHLLLALIAFLLALAPTAPVFGIDFDHENSRMLYFPVAVFLIAGATSWRPPTTASQTVIYALVLYWGIVSLANGISWSRADRELRDTLTYLAEHQEALPPDATVLVAGHDTWHGAYAWRNALYLATRRANLRPDIDWRLGTAALVDGAKFLTGHVFELEVHPTKAPRNLTACQRSLHLETPPPQAVLSLDSLPQRRDALGLGSRLDLPPILLEIPVAAPALMITTREPLAQPIEGLLFWRYPGVASFNITEARRFRITPEGRQTIIRLVPPPVALERLELRLETQTPDALSRLGEVRLLEGPALCLSPPP